MGAPTDTLIVGGTLASEWDLRTSGTLKTIVLLDIHDALYTHTRKQILCCKESGCRPLFVFIMNCNVCAKVWNSVVDVGLLQSILETDHVCLGCFSH